MKQLQLFTKTLPANTATLVDLFQAKHPEFLNDFYLSGGTALSLQLGHRESEDLDFFIQNEFNPTFIQQQLLTIGRLENTELAAGTLNTFVDGVKLQFLHYPYDLLKPATDWNRIKLSSIEDIACTKLQTIGMRGSKKDFVDLYFLLEEYSLDNLFQLMKKKYSGVNYSKTHILKSLVYFNDADQQPMPKMHRSVNWDEVKKQILTMVKNTSL